MRFVESPHQRLALSAIRQGLGCLGLEDIVPEATRDDPLDPQLLKTAWYKVLSSIFIPGIALGGGRGSEQEAGLYSTPTIFEPKSCQGQFEIPWEGRWGQSKLELAIC